MNAADVLLILRRAVPAALVEEVASVDMPAISVERGPLVETARALRDDPALNFAFLADVTAVDYRPAEPRFEVVYHLACLGAVYPTRADARTSPSRLRVKVRVPGDDARLPSVTSVWPTAGWLEREVFDLFGLVFDDHPDLRRILMPDDWEGHPLRKDYPVQVRKDTALWSPIQISAEEFAANVRAAQESARRRARRNTGNGGGGGGRE